MGAIRPSAVAKLKLLKLANSHFTAKYRNGKVDARLSVSYSYYGCAPFWHSACSIHSFLFALKKWGGGDMYTTPGFNPGVR